MQTSPARARHNSGPILSIQYLRAFAALAVVVFHALEAAPLRFVVGAAGVDVFFVISGFIMWTLTEKAETSPGAFLWRRLIRVAPTYWLATLAIVGLVTVRPHFLWMAPFDAADIARSLLFVPFHNAWGATQPVLIQGWTLNYEIFFYLCFALAMLAPRRLQLVLLTAAFGLLIGLGVLLHPKDAVDATYTSPLLGEFIAGAWLGQLWLSGRLTDARGGLVLVLAGLAGFAASARWISDSDPLRVVYWGLPALAIVAGGLCLERAGRVPNLPLLRLLGDGSYSIYLFHIPVIAVFYRLLGEFPGLRVSATVVACAALGVVMFKLVESPLNRKLRALGGLTPRPKIVTSGAA